MQLYLIAIILEYYCFYNKLKYSLHIKNFSYNDSNNIKSTENTEQFHNNLGVFMKNTKILLIALGVLTTGLHAHDRQLTSKPLAQSPAFGRTTPSPSPSRLATAGQRVVSPYLLSTRTKADQYAADQASFQAALERSKARSAAKTSASPSSTEASSGRPSAMRSPQAGVSPSRLSPGVSFSPEAMVAAGAHSVVDGVMDEAAFEALIEDSCAVGLVCSALGGKTSPIATRKDTPREVDVTPIKTLKNLYTAWLLGEHNPATLDLLYAFAEKHDLEAELKGLLNPLAVVTEDTDEMDDMFRR
jgi:hypothetical protein